MTRRRGAAWERLGHGIAIPAGLVGAMRSAAVLEAWSALLPPGGCFTGLTAAAAHGLWLPPLPASAPIFVALPYEVRLRRAGALVVTRHPVPVASQALPSGPRVATVAETVLACARVLGLLDLVVLVDGVLHTGRLTPAELQVMGGLRRRGAPRLREALRHADRRSESPWETLLRMLHLACGIAVEPQAVLEDAGGRFIARADLLIAGTRTLQEYDGAHHRQPGQYARDRRRDAALAINGYVRHGWGARDVIGRSAHIYAAACEALGQRVRLEVLDGWHELLAGSLFTQEGHRRWPYAEVDRDGGQ